MLQTKEHPRTRRTGLGLCEGRKVALIGRTNATPKRPLAFEVTIFLPVSAKAKGRDYESTAMTQAKAVFGPTYRWEAVAL